VAIAKATARSRGPAAAALSQCHVSDHANEVDGTIAFASRGLDAPAIALSPYVQVVRERTVVVGD